MKTNFYLLLIFLLAFTFGNAQSTTETVKVEINNTVSVSETATNTTEEMLIDASEIKESIARSTSDIKIYFNRLRNVDNLNLLFPKINNPIKA